MGKLISYILGLLLIIFIGMFLLVIILWVLNLLLFVVKWIALVAIFVSLIMAIINFRKSKSDKTVRHFLQFLYIAVAALLLFGISSYFQPKLHTYLTEEKVEQQVEEKKSVEVETVNKAVEQNSEKELAVSKAEAESKKKEEELKFKKEEEKRRDAEEAAKKKEAAKEKKEQEKKRLAEEKAKKPISTDFASFDNPYDQMTDLQKDNYWKEVKGKYVQWTGEVIEVTEDTISIKSEADTLIDDFIANIVKEQKETLIDINIGDSITIYGQLSSKEGVILSWQLENAEIK